MTTRDIIGKRRENDDLGKQSESTENDYQGNNRKMTGNDDLGKQSENTENDEQGNNRKVTGK